MAEWVFPAHAVLTLYPAGFCSISKVALVQCEQEFMFCCSAAIVLKRSQCEQKPYPATLPFDLKRSFTKTLTGFRCNFCSDKSVQTRLRTFQKPIQYRTFSRTEQYWFRSRNCFENSVPSVSRNPIRYTFCDPLFHYWYSA